MLFKRLFGAALVGIGAVISFSSASAAIVFEFGTIVEGAPMGGPMYARLTITDAGVDTVSLVLENTATLPDAAGQAIQRLHLNVDPFIMGLVISSADEHFEGFNYTQDGQNDAGSMFDLKINLDVAPPSDRFLPGETMTMTATATGLTEGHFANLSAGVPRQAMIHIISIPPDGEGSAKVTTPVPEPASVAALGLGALALLRRRRKN
jgi:hypothetical protein